jgi:bacteriorhodopsin
MIPDQLTKGQFDSVNNLLSLALAALVFTAIYLLAAQPRVLPRYRQALLVGAIVCGIAGYNYFRIFDSFRAAFVNNAAGGNGIYARAPGVSFDEGYRYVDWLLTVPLLLVELVMVLAFAKKVQASLLWRLIPASTLMIALGYCGEISGKDSLRNVFGLAATIPFAFIVYVLFVELTRSLDRQPPAVRQTVSRVRILLFATWGVYPIAYLLPLLDVNGADAWVGKQFGYSVADIAAKAVYGLLIYKIARIKSFTDDPVFAEVETAFNQSGNAGRYIGEVPPKAVVTEPRR